MAKYSNRQAMSFQYYKDGKRIVSPYVGGFTRPNSAKEFANQEFLFNWNTLEFDIPNPAYGAEMIDAGFGFFFVRQKNGRFKTFGQQCEPEDFGPVDFSRVADFVDYSMCR